MNHACFMFSLNNDELLLTRVMDPENESTLIAIKRLMAWTLLHIAKGKNYPVFHSLPWFQWNVRYNGIWPFFTMFSWYNSAHLFLCTRCIMILSFSKFVIEVSYLSVLHTSIVTSMSFSKFVVVVSSLWILHTGLLTNMNKRDYSS